MKIISHICHRFAATAALSLLLVAGATQPTWAQSAPSPEDLKRDRNRGLVMLQHVRDIVKEDYYDSNYHGIDLAARFKQAEEKMKEATSLSHVLGIVAQTLVELNDSHTFFVPPSRPVEVDYGWTMQIIGENCYVASVKTGSDAEEKGLKPGDEVLSVDGFKPTRQNLWKMEYNYNVLRPQPGKRVVVRAPDGQQRELVLKAKVEKRPKQVNITEIYNELYEEREDDKKLPRYFELNDGGVFIWKLREFGLTEARVDDTLKKARAYKSLILDLRGNGGGYEVTLKRLVGSFFDRDITIGQAKGRKSNKTIAAKTRGDKVFKGNLIVLIDSKSSSAAEIFARIVQLEKRGTVIGDRSAGAVMRAIYRPGLMGDMSSSNKVPFGASVTVADLIMTDGKSLEHAGVTPDELVLPTPADLAAKRDPVLARAAALAGAQLSAEKAGSMFPIEKEK